MSQIGKLQTWKIPSSKLQYWRRLNPDIPKHEAKDCAVNSLQLLGVIENPFFANYLSKYTYTREGVKGLLDSELLSLIFDRFNIESQQKITNHILGKKTDRQIFHEMENDTYTLAIYYPVNEYGNRMLSHAVVITKQNDQLYVLDPQQEKIYCGFADYNQWIERNNWSKDTNGDTNVICILKSKTTRGRHETKLTLRKPRSRSRSRSRKRPRIGNTP